MRCYDCASKALVFIAHKLLGGRRWMRCQSCGHIQLEISEGDGPENPTDTHQLRAMPELLGVAA